MKKFVVCVILCWICAVKSVAGSVPGFHSFEDYLQHVMSRSDNDDVANNFTNSTSNELLSYFRTIPRDHWSCCMLGLLAGSKGFHCRAQYYSSSAVVSRRNLNRAQTARQPTADSRRRGYSISRSFHRCVGGGVAAAGNSNANEFHKCCYAASEERRQLRRARQYRRRQQGPGTRRPDRLK